MKTEPKEQAKPPFKIAIIDMIDAYHYADVFEDERYVWLGYQGYAEYVDYDVIVALADRLFWALNPKAATQEDWTKWDAGYDVRIYDANSNCVYKANEILPTAKVKQRADEEIGKILDEVMWSEKMTEKKQLSEQKLVELRKDYIQSLREEKDIKEGKKESPNLSAQAMREKILEMVVNKFKNVTYPKIEEKWLTKDDLPPCDHGEPYNA